MSRTFKELTERLDQLCSGNSVDVEQLKEAMDS